jgi:aminoglycoside phosphotransferase (APT) family kinase protein
MRQDWIRITPEIKLDRAAVGELVAAFRPGCAVADITALRGGLVNTNFEVRLFDRGDPILLRLYQRDRSLACKEVAVIRWVSGQVPVPRVLYFSEANPVTGHPYALMDWVEGQPLQAIMARRDRRGRASLGRSIGHTLAAIHRFRFEEYGFFDADLRVTEPFGLARDDLLAYLHTCLIEGPGGARLGQDLTAALLAFVEHEGDILDERSRPCLVHADFNPSNILVRPRPGSDDWEVAAILDWEFACSGTPSLDFGNLLRPPLDRVEDFAEALAAGYCEAGGELPDEWQRLARLADLFAWADNLRRPEADPALIEDARAIIRGTIAG